jgi:hypothetical protein
MNRAIALLLLIGVSLADAGAQGWTPARGKTATVKKQSRVTAVPKPAPKALVYVYRPKHFGGAAAPSIYCDRKELAKIDNGRFFVARLNPGRHMFLQGDDDQPGMAVDAKAGGKYYIRVEVAKRFWKGQNRMTLVAPEQGKEEVKKLVSLDADQIVDNAIVAIPGEDDDALVDRDEPKKSAKSDWD